MNLSPAQRAAVLLDSPTVAVNSTAGSGKTRVAVCRAARLAMSGVPTLLLAFNRAAAAEMEERLSAFRLGNARAMTLSAAAYRVAVSGLDVGGVDPRSADPLERERAKEWREFLNDQVRSGWCRNGKELSKREFIKVGREIRALAQESVSRMVPVRELSSLPKDGRYLSAAEEALAFHRSRGWSGFSSLDLSTEYAIHVLNRGGAPRGFERVGAIVVDECLPGDQRVTLADGSRLPIREIVDRRMDVEVLSYDERTGRVVPRRVTGWHRNPRRGRGIISTNGVRATEDHLVYARGRGYLALRDLVRTPEAEVLCLREDLQREPTHLSGAVDPGGLATWRLVDHPAQGAAGECSGGDDSRYRAAHVPGVETERVVQVGEDGASRPDQEKGETSGDDWVYCLEVEETHNFFAEGVLVSNCQDLSPLQWCLVDSLAEETGADLVIVGDSDQCIYEWRQADLDEFLARCREYSRVDISQNYRCGRVILDAASTLIQKNRWRVVHQIESGVSHVGRVEALRVATPREEAAWVVSRIREALASVDSNLGRVPSPADFSVLTRTNADRALVELGLFRAGVPYRTRGAALWESPEVELVVCGLRALAGRREHLEEAVLGLPGVGPMTVRRAREAGGDFLAAVVERARGRGALSASALLELSRTAAGKTLAERVRALCTIYLTEAGGTEVDEAEESAVAAALSELAARFTELEDLESFLQEAVDDARPAVTISTIHRTKGLEWPYVFVLRVNEKTLPHARAETPRDVEAERRLLYVAMTRAIHGLFLLSSGLDAYGRPAKPSRFFRDAGIVVATGANSLTEVGT